MRRLPGIDPDFRTIEEPWRIVWVPGGNNPSTRRLYDPWLTAEFIRLDVSQELGFEVVGWELAQQFEADVADRQVAALAGRLVTDAFFAVPPEGGNFDELYVPAQIIEP